MQRPQSVSSRAGPSRAEPSVSRRSQAFDGWALLAALCDLAFQPLSASVTQTNTHAHGIGRGGGWGWGWGVVGSTNSTNNIRHKRGDEEM